MLQSVKIQKRQSEIRQKLAALVGEEKPTDEQRAEMAALDAEYQSNETRYRAALIAEDTERREAGAELETRADRERDALLARFETAQVVMALHEGRALSGPTLEIVTEMRNAGGYQGIPIPWAALERRVGETISTGVVDPLRTRPIIDRLFPDSVAARMGASLITIDHGAEEWPITSSAVAAAWQATETGAVGGPAAYTTAERSLKPAQTLGITMKITRKALKQSGDGLEQAVRRDMSGCIQQELDKSIFLGSGASGEPLGVVSGQATYGYGTTAVGATASWGAFRNVVSAFMAANAAASPAAVRVLTHPQTYNFMDGDIFDPGSGITEWDRLLRNIPAANIALSSNATVLTAGTPDTTTALLTTAAGGVAPIFVGVWGGVDVIRDPYSDAASGGLRLTGLVTADVTISRAPQLHLLTALQVE